MNNDAQLNLVFSALSDPTRRAIVARLANGQASVSELVEPFDLAQPNISRHLRVLEEAGLIVTARDGQRRPRSLAAGPLKELDAWLAPFRAQWERRFDRLESFLGSRAGASKQPNRPKSTKSRKKETK